MALIQDIEIGNTGVIATYWRITHVSSDISAGDVEIKLHGYINKLARDSGKSPVTVYASDGRGGALRICAEDMPDGIHVITTQHLYEWVKRNIPEFAMSQEG